MSSTKGAFKKYVRGEGRSFKPKKWPDISNSKQKFFLISCLAVAKRFAFLSLAQHVKVFFFREKGGG